MFYRTDRLRKPNAVQCDPVMFTVHLARPFSRPYRTLAQAASSRDR